MNTYDVLIFLTFSLVACVVVIVIWMALPKKWPACGSTCSYSCSTFYQQPDLNVIPRCIHGTWLWWHFDQMKIPSSFHASITHKNVFVIHLVSCPNVAQVLKKGSDMMLNTQKKTDKVWQFNSCGTILYQYWPLE